MGPATSDSRRASFFTDQPAEVCAVIVTYNNAEDILGLLDSLREEAYATRIRVVVVDNCSTDHTLALLSTQVDVVVVSAERNLGYAGGINRAASLTKDSQYILVLNPDLRLLRGCLRSMLNRMPLTTPSVVVPLILASDGTAYLSIRREPTVARALGDALLGSHIPNRPACFGEIEYGHDAYERAHPIEWATGAALLMSGATARAVGPWCEDFFLYSEEVDFLRRVRENGGQVWFEPAAKVIHRGGGSGSSRQLVALMTVNRVRYFRRNHNWAHSALFAVAVMVSETMRLHKPERRLALRALLSSSVRASLPGGTAHLPAAVRETYVPYQLELCGSVIIPAHNEEAVIDRTLSSIAPLVDPMRFEVIVVCNGCSDRTAEVARTYTGVKVIESTRASKTSALNEGDLHASFWPRLYLDADIEIAPEAIAAIFSVLKNRRALAARPSSVYDVSGSTALVRAYYRARTRMASLHTGLWGAGAYAVTRTGRERFDWFPEVLSDDLWIDLQFEQQEKVVSEDAPPVIVRTPRTIPALVRVLRRSYRGNHELRENAGGRAARSTRGYAKDLVRSVRGPQSLADSITYALVSILARSLARSGSSSWARDETSRVRFERSHVERLNEEPS